MDESHIDRIRLKKDELSAIVPHPDDEARTARVSELTTQLESLRTKIAETQAELDELAEIKTSRIGALVGARMSPQTKQELLTQGEDQLTATKEQLGTTQDTLQTAQTLPTAEELDRQKALADRLLSLSEDPAQLHGSPELQEALHKQDATAPRLKAEALRTAVLGAKKYEDEAPERRRIAVRERLELPTDPDSAFPDEILDTIIGVDPADAKYEGELSEGQIQEIKRQQASYKLARDFAEKEGITLDRQAYVDASTLPLHGRWKYDVGRELSDYQAFQAYFGKRAMWIEDGYYGSPSFSRLAITAALASLRSTSNGERMRDNASLCPNAIGMTAELLDRKLSLGTQSVIFALAETFMRDTTGKIIGSNSVANTKEYRFDISKTRQSFDQTCETFLTSGLSIRDDNLQSRPRELMMALALAKALSIVRELQRVGGDRFQGGNQSLPDSIKLRIGYYELKMDGDSTVESLQARYDALLERDHPKAS